VNLRQEEKLRELKGKASGTEWFGDSLLNKSPIPTVIFDKDFAILYANPAFESVTGFSLKEIIGLKPPFPYWPETHHKEYLNAYQRNSGLHIELLFQKKNGEAFWVELVRTPISEAGTPGCYLVTMIDITKRKQAEQALLENEKKLSGIYVTMHEGLAIHRMLYDASSRPVDYIVLDINPAFTSVVGVKREDVIGRKMSELLPNEAPPWLDIFSKVASTGEPVALETYYPPTNKYLSISAFSPDKDIVATFFIDITERKLAEEAHRKSEEKFTKVFHSSPELIGISTLDTGEFIEVNDSATRITGYNREEIIGHTVLELKIWKNESDRAKMRDVIKEKGRILNYEAGLRMKTGEIRTGLVSAELIEIGSELCIIWVCTDITDRKKAEQTLKQSEAFNQALMSNTPYPMLVTNTDTSIRLVNPAFERLTGFSNSELVGCKVPYPWWSEESRALYHDGGPFNTRDAAFSTEICHLKKSGEPFWVVTNIKTVEIESDAGFLMTTWTDITERKKAQDELTLSKEKLEELYRKEKVQKEELEEEAKARGMFIDVLAHELRTPLTPMLSSTALLKEVLKSEPRSIQSRLVANINSSGQALASRLEELLEVARYSRGTFKLNIQPVDLKEFFRQAISRFKPSLEQTQNLLFTDLSEDLPVAELDASRMEQVIINLLSNASKYSPPESRMYMKAALNGSNLEVVVKDEGIGISPEEQNNIFKPYHRVTQDRKVPGLGLGLAVCKQIIEAHGGKIWVESQLGQGSTFGFSIPIKIVNIDD
jgi:PAS domain S-box-containing protein